MPKICMRDPGGFRQNLRPACRRCTARRGITEPVACYLPPHLTVCRRHRLWIGPSARTDAGQLDVSQLPEVLGAQRRHLDLVYRHHWRHADDAISDAARAIGLAISAGTWTPHQERRLRELGICTRQQAAPAVNPGWPDNGPGFPALEIAIYPDVIRLAARSLRACGASWRLPA
jgi:hypothetical protein